MNKHLKKDYSRYDDIFKGFIYLLQFNYRNADVQL